jgi:hypothetical protein
MFFLDSRFYVRVSVTGNYVPGWLMSMRDLFLI